MQDKGHFIISLDFEIMWGVRDHATKKTYGDNLLGVQEVIPRTLSLFEEFNIKGTFATVGFLFFYDKKEMISHTPELRPGYTNEKLYPYGKYMEQEVGEDHRVDKFHFAPHLIQLIKDTPGQEIGTHTFSHYYCLEPGQTIESFRADLKAAIDIAKINGIGITSIVFPRNQYNENYINICREHGILAYRNNEHSWIYAARGANSENMFRRAVRLIDCYISLSGHHCHSNESMRSSFPVNIPSSRFLRPYSSKLKLLDKLRMQRIKKAMTHAAKNKLMYHLWWHPHNFGINQNENFSFLRKILEHYRALNIKYDFESITMTGLASSLAVR